jgi:Arc/MetJ family transcription regulator
MRTTLNVDERLLEEVVCETGEKDKGRAVNAAMTEFIRRRKVDRLLASRGAFPDLIDRTDQWEEEEIRLENEHKRDRTW